MVLTRIEPANNSAALISIPRDLCIASCRTEPYRINSVYQAEGPDVLRQRVGEIMGLKVDYVMVLDFYGFRRLIDFFGGVEVDVSTTIYDESYPNATDTGFEPCTYRPGSTTSTATWRCDMRAPDIRAARLPGTSGNNSSARPSRPVVDPAHDPAVAEFSGATPRRLQDGRATGSRSPNVEARPGHRLVARGPGSRGV